MKIAGSINYCVILNLLVRRTKTKENHIKWESENITLKRKKKSGNSASMLINLSETGNKTIQNISKYRTITYAFNSSRIDY